ncbi:hypothetical protein TNCV_3855291 [Trichonephila clavipes]|nr:hypothetical protein TNCV_3855291 [Trichonephila clavipes]
MTDLRPLLIYDNSISRPCIMINYRRCYNGRERTNSIPRSKQSRQVADTAGSHLKVIHYSDRVIEDEDQRTIVRTASEHEV